jgi:branched-chain amino acid transport system permease protein
LFFGTAGYSVALIARDLDIASIFVVIPTGVLIGFVGALLLGSFLCLGVTRPASSSSRSAP